MRRILLILGIVLLVGAAAIAALLFFVDVNQFRGPIQAQLQRSLDRTVTLGPTGLSLVPLSIRVSDLTIGESPVFRSSHPFASAKEVNVRVGLLALLKGRVAVRSLRLVQPVVELIRNEKGVWNYSSLGGAREGRSDRALTIDDLQILDGSIAVTDLAARKPRVLYQHIDLGLRDFAPGKRFNLDLTARLPGSGGQIIALQARGTGLSDLAGRISVKQAALSALQRFLGSGASPFDAVLTGDTGLRSENGLLVATGKLAMDKARLHGSGLGFGIQADYRLRYDTSRELLEIHSLNVMLGPTPVSASGEVNLKAEPSSAQLKAVVRNASLTELARLAGVPGDLKGVVSLETSAQGALDRPEAWVWTGSGSVNNASVTSPEFARPVGIRSARVDFRRQASGLNLQFQADVDEVSLAQSSAPSSSGAGASKPGGLRDVSGGGKLTLGTLRYGDIVLTQLRADCVLEEGVLRMAPITARLYGGQQSGSIVVDMRQSHPSFTVNTRLEQVDANQFLSATTSLKQTLYGLLSTNADVAFAARPGEDIARSLNGTVNLKLHKGKLAGINLMNEVASIAKFLGFRKSGEVATNIVDLAGDLKVANGIARTDNLILTLEDGSALASGTVNLADQTLDTRLLMTLNKGLSAQVGGSNIGGFMTTVFGNEKGELIVPVVISGTLPKPRVTPDAERIAQMKLKGLVPGRTSVAPGNIQEKVEGLVDLFRRKKKP